MNGGGWIKLPRKIRENLLWPERRRFSKLEAWIDILLDAAYVDHDALLGSSVIRVKRGQALISQRKKAAHWSWARNTVASFISLLAKRKILSHETRRGPDGGYTLITISDYDQFQSLGDQGDSAQLSHDQSHALSHDRATIEPQFEQSEEREEGERREKNIKAFAAPPETGVPAPVEKPEPTPKKPKARKTHPDTQAILAEFLAEYNFKFSTAYVPSFARDQKILSELLVASGPDEVRTRMKHFFENGTKRTRESGDYGVPAFRWVFNDLGVMIARGDL